MFQHCLVVVETESINWVIREAFKIPLNSGTYISGFPRPSATLFYRNLVDGDESRKIPDAPSIDKISPTATVSNLHSVPTMQYILCGSSRHSLFS